MGRFLGHLGHPHRVVRGVEAVERGGVQVELVAQHEDQVAQFSHGAPLARRQASEQNFTSSQLRAQRRRQVIGRPQAAQGLLGRAALLPRNAGAGGVIGNALGLQQLTSLGDQDAMIVRKRVNGASRLEN